MKKPHAQSISTSSLEFKHKPKNEQARILARQAKRQGEKNFKESVNNPFAQIGRKRLL